MNARLRLRISARASRDAIRGWHDGALKISITTAPEKGKANTAILKLLAKALGVSPSTLVIVHGHTSSDKLVEVSGLTQNMLEAKLQALLSH